MIPAVMIAFAMLWCSAFSMRIMLGLRYVVATPRLFRYTIVAYAASVLAPARAGELARLWLLKQRDGVPVADSAAAVVAQNVVDGVTMFVFVAPLVPDLPVWVGRAIVVGAVIAVTAFAAIYVAVGRLAGRVPRTWLTRFIAGMHVVRSPRRVLLVISAHLVAWLAVAARPALSTRSARRGERREGASARHRVT